MKSGKLLLLLSFNCFLVLRITIWNLNIIYSFFLSIIMLRIPSFESSMVSHVVVFQRDLSHAA